MNGFLQRLRWADYQTDQPENAVGLPDGRITQFDGMASRGLLAAYYTWLPDQPRVECWGRLTLWMKYVEGPDIPIVELACYDVTNEHAEALEALGVYRLNGGCPGVNRGHYVYTTDFALGSLYNRVSTILFDMRPCRGYPLIWGLDAARFEHYVVLR